MRVGMKLGLVLLVCGSLLLASAPVSGDPPERPERPERPDVPKKVTYVICESHEPEISYRWRDVEGAKKWVKAHNEQTGHSAYVHTEWE